MKMQLLKRGSIIFVLALLVTWFSCRTEAYAASSVGAYEKNGSGKWYCVRIFQKSGKNITFTLQNNNGQTKKIKAKLARNKAKFSSKGLKKNTKIKGTLKLSTNKVKLKTTGTDSLSTKGKTIVLKKISSEPMF